MTDSFTPKTVQKIIVSATSRKLPIFLATVLGTVALTARSGETASVTWDLEFFQGTNPVGVGSFSYDDSIFVLIPNLENSENDVLVNSAITNFSANILNARDWSVITDNRPGLLTYRWWADGSTPPGISENNRDRFFGFNIWRFGDDFGDEALILDEMLQTSETVWGGNWFQAFSFDCSDDDPSSSRPCLSNGTWVATRRDAPISVPDPASILALFSVAGLGTTSVCRRRTD